MLGGPGVLQGYREAEEPASACKRAGRQRVTVLPVVPVDLLQLWSWGDLERAISGTRKMDLELLKKNTEVMRHARTTFF